MGLAGGTRHTPRCSSLAGDVNKKLVSQSASTFGSTIKAWSFDHDFLVPVELDPVSCCILETDTLLGLCCLFLLGGGELDTTSCLKISVN